MTKKGKEIVPKGKKQGPPKITEIHVTLPADVIGEPVSQRVIAEFPHSTERVVCNIKPGVAVVGFDEGATQVVETTYLIKGSRSRQSTTTQAPKLLTSGEKR